MEFARFMSSGIGRLARIIAGLILIAIGFGAVGGAIGWVIAIIGLVPIAAGAFNVCMVSPLLKVPFRGQDVQ